MADVVYVGQFLTMYSPRFNALNLCRVTEIERGKKLFRVVFIAPDSSPLKPKGRLPGDSEFTVWESDLQEEVLFTVRRGSFSKRERTMAAQRYARLHVTSTDFARNGPTSVWRECMREWEEYGKWLVIGQPRKAPKVKIK